MKKLNIQLTQDHPVYQWVNTQADKVGARGHIGTHLDCYTCTPDKDTYQIPLYVIDCREAMPHPSKLDLLLLPSQAGVLLHTGNLEQNGYGTSAYMGKNTSLPYDVLEVMLEKHPQFILIDSHGIGLPGKEHVDRDKLCESKGCHVIENIDCSLLTGQEKELIVKVDLNHPSSGKPCEVYVR